MSEFLKTDPERQARLKAVIARLHAGAGVAEVKREFASLIKGVSAEEVAAMEQALVDEGFPVSEIQRLCEVHVEVFEGALARGGKAERMAGHPVHSLMAENREAARLARRLLGAARRWAWGSAAASAEAGAALEELARIEIHYARKENQVFPYLERAGFTGPSKVMWGKHDEIRALLREAREAYRSAAGREGARAFRAKAAALVAALRRMIFMEERILVPNALKKLSERDWAEIRLGEAAIGFAWIEPGAVYDAGLVLARTRAGGAGAAAVPEEPSGLGAAATPAAGAEPPRSPDPSAPIALNTGALPADLLDLVLRRLPIDVSVVDEHDRVLYYSDSPERVFPRSPAIIGREVRNCHPPKSVATVERILDAFRKKEKSEARFWIKMGPKFVVIDYRALYDAAGNYRGCLEISQDAAGLRALEGERRLLDWD